MNDYYTIDVFDKKEERHRFTYTSDVAPALGDYIDRYGTEYKVKKVVLYTDTPSITVYVKVKK